MAHGGDHRNGAAVQGPGHQFFVEGPQIFQGAAPPGQDDDLHFRITPQIIQGPGNLSRRRDALHLHRVDEHVDVGKPRPQEAQKIPHRRAGGGGDQGDLARQERQGLFQFGGKQPLRLEAGLQGLEGLGQGPQPRGSR